MTKLLWGDHFFDPTTKKWQKHSNPAEAGAKPLKRAFVSYIMEPVIRLCRATKQGEIAKVEKLLETIGIEALKPEEKELPGKELMKRVFQRWINAAEALLELIILKLPSPVEAQKYRAANLYEGAIDDVSGQAMKNCDKDGPVMVFISKMIPTNEGGKGGARFYAFGRVFSGTVRAGEPLRIMGPKYKPGDRTDLNIQKIQRVGIMIPKFESMTDGVPAGNTVALAGIDKYILKQGTIASDINAHVIKSMKYTVSPVVRVAVAPADPKNLEQFRKGLERLIKQDPLVQHTLEDTGENIIAGCGELHIEICLKDLEEEYARCKIKKGDPVVSYKESVTEESSQVCLAKSGNKHNRIFAKAEPLGEDLTKYIEKELLGPRMDKKESSKLLVNTFEWDKNDTQKIWCYGPQETGPNILVD